MASLVRVELVPAGEPEVPAVIGRRISYSAAIRRIRTGIAPSLEHGLDRDLPDTARSPDPEAHHGAQPAWA
jgi:hypothetical protein